MSLRSATCRILVSSAMAAILTEAGPAALLAGSGLRDVTRIAAGDPAL